MSMRSQSNHSNFDQTGSFDAGLGNGLPQIDTALFGAIGSVAAPGGFGPASATQQVAPSLPSFSVLGATSTSSRVSTSTSFTTISTTTTATTTSSTPSWISTLKTASIASDMAAADVNGTVSYAGLEKVFADLDATLASSRTTLTAAELADLKTIAANLNNGMSTSGYLTSITNALVNGNAGNATWTGGAASATSLGNLAAGSSATQLSELIGKWFLGTDLPSSSVSMDGSNFSVSYSAVSKPLFASTGPSMNDINQGYLGDCYLLSGLAEVAKQNSSKISSMFTSNGNNTYGVRFYVNGVAEYVTVNNSLANGGTEFNSGADLWASLAEKAYAQLQGGGVVTGNSINYGNSWSTIGNGGAPEFALEEITGASTITDFDANGGSWMKVVYNSSFGMTGYSTGNATASVLSTLAADLAKGDDVILSSYTNATDAAGRTTLVASHAMSIYGYDSATGMLQVRNPWGSESWQYWDTTFEVSLSTLLADGDTITVDNVGDSPRPSSPTVTNQTAAQTWKRGQSVSFKLASNTFTDPQGSALTLSAKQSNGTALPSWLSFNAATGTFSGTVASSANGLSVTVTATDALGLSASETFSISTPAPAAPVVTAPTATQTWKLGQAVSFTLASNTFTDPQGEALTYSATLSNGAALPSWLTFSAATGKFSGAVPNTATGLSIKVTATDAGGVSASEIFSVLTPASAPTVTAQTAAQTLKTGQTFNFALASNTFTDPQGEKLTFSATQSSGAALPTWLKFNSTSDSFSGTAPTTASSLTLKVTATDSSGLSVSETFGLSVSTAAALMTQAIASTVGGSSSSSTLTHSTASSPTTLASPLH